jgi:hypothetical protein
MYQYNDILREHGREAAQAYLEDLVARGELKVIPRDRPMRQRRARARHQS